METPADWILDNCRFAGNKRASAFVVPLRLKDGQIEVLIVRRKKNPHAGEWSFPGGWLNDNERSPIGARRELKEETNLSPSEITQIDNGVYMATISSSAVAKAGSDADAVKWVSVKKVPHLAFDDKQYIDTAIRMFKTKGKTANWILKNCKFSQTNPPQQQWFDFDPPGSYTENPMELEDPSFKTDVQDYISEKPEQQAEYVDGFFHVTTNLTGVLEWGRLKSRQQLGEDTPGLGGGYQNEAPNMVSLTYSSQKAYEIYEALSYAASICKGQVPASKIFDGIQQQYSGMEVYPDSAVMGVLKAWGLSRRVLNDEFLEGLEVELDKKIKSAKAKYDFMQQLDDAFGKDEGEMNSDGMDYSPPSRVGFTVPYETFCQIDPANIAILRVQVRKGANPQHVNQEMELRFDPDDIRLPMNPVVRQGGQ